MLDIFWNCTFHCYFTVNSPLLLILIVFRMFFPRSFSVVIILTGKISDHVLVDQILHLLFLNPFTVHCKSKFDMYEMFSSLR